MRTASKRRSIKLYEVQQRVNLGIAAIIRDSDPERLDELHGFDLVMLRADLAAVYLNLSLRCWVSHASFQ